MSSDGSSDIFGFIMLMVISVALSLIGFIAWLGWRFAGWWGLITVAAVLVFVVAAFILNRRNK